eukprot:scaffold840_cov344-Pavlova_lutheri.AAC.120
MPQPTACQPRTDREPRPMKGDIILEFTYNSPHPHNDKEEGRDATVERQRHRCMTQPEPNACQKLVKQLTLFSRTALTNTKHLFRNCLRLSRCPRKECLSVHSACSGKSQLAHNATQIKRSTY